jgi:hypothetical protein
MNGSWILTARNTPLWMEWWWNDYIFNDFTLCYALDKFRRSLG